jgi:peptide/nickel transport system permease protein
VAGYLLRRIASALLALLGISLLAFCTTALVPGNPAEVLLGTEATPDRVRALTHSLGLDKPLPDRYFYWLRSALHGDLGASTLSHQAVTTLLLSSLKVTFELTLLSALLALLVAIPLGLLLGSRNDRWWTPHVMFGVTIGMSVPGFVTGLILIIVFSVRLGWFPAGGFVPFTVDPLENLRHMVLPAVALALWLAPPLARFLRATTVGVMREEYVMTATAKGMSNRRLLARHVAPNAGIPMITYFGLQLGTLIGGAIVTEVIFALPGMGRLGLNSILDRDYPVVQGVVLVVAAGYIVVNLAIDLLYGVIDPRVRVS